METIVLERPTLDKASQARELEFSGCFEATHEAVFRALLAICRDRQTAEDCLGDAYLKAWERWDQVRLLDNPTGWLVRVAVNSSISLWRRLRRSSRVASPLSDVTSEGPTDRLDTLAAVGALPTRQRQVIALRLLVGFNTKETASILGIAEGTVTAHMSAALAALRRRLEAPERGPNHG